MQCTVFFKLIFKYNFFAFKFFEFIISISGENYDVLINKYMTHIILQKMISRPTERILVTKKLGMNVEKRKVFPKGCNCTNIAEIF